MKESMRSSNTAERLKEIMQERGFRQVDLLERVQPLCRRYEVKLQKNTLSQYLSGVSAPKQDKLFVLAKALNVSEAWLMGFDVPRERDTFNVEEDMDDDLLRICTAYKSLSDQGREMLVAQAEFLLSRESNEGKKQSSAG